MIKLIINADDFGLSKVFNQKILELLKKGFIKSTTVMVNRMTEDQIKQIKQLIKLRDTEKISIGLHLEFNIDKPRKPQIIEQYKKFISIFNFKPSHLDIHKLTDKKEVILEVNKFAEKNNLPVRNHSVKANTKLTDYPVLSSLKFSLNEIINFLQKMEDGKSYELMTHPGEYDPNSKSSLNEKRKVDYDNIAKLQKFLKLHKNIRIISYLEL